LAADGVRSGVHARPVPFCLGMLNLVDLFGGVENSITA
jgi:hypothetical protein